LRALFKLAITEFKLFLREPAATFWVIAFPVLWMVFFGILYPEGPKELGYGDISEAQYLLPGGIGIIIIAASFMGMTINIATYRNLGILRRFRVTPLKTSIFMGSHLMSQCLQIAVGISLLFMAGLFFDAGVEGSIPELIALIILGMLSFLALAFALASVAKTPRSAGLISMLIFFPMIFLCEIWFPIEDLPSWLQPVAEVLPLTPLNHGLRDVILGWGGLRDNLLNLGILSAWLIAGLLISLKWFRWE
jgi:ABC-2 type transport system permease protein